METNGKYDDTKGERDARYREGVMMIEGDDTGVRTGNRRNIRLLI